MPPQVEQPVNNAPSISALSDTKSEEDSAYVVDLLSGGTDADGDTLSVINSALSAVDQDGNSVTLADGAATVSGTSLSIDPDAFDPLTTGQSVTLTLAYDVSDGNEQTPTQAVVFREN